MNTNLESSLKEGWQVEEVDGKKMLAIYVKGERIQLHDLADFSQSLSDELQNKSLNIKRDDMTFDDMKESFYSFLSIVLYPELSWSNSVMRTAIDSMLDEKRTLIVKAREFGISKLLQAFAVWRAAFYGEDVAIIVGASYESSKIIKDITADLSKASIGNLQVTGSSDKTSFSSGGGIKVIKTVTQTKGQSFDVVLLDEFAYLDEDIWKVLIPNLSVNDTKTIIASTPDTRDHIFYRQYSGGMIYKNTEISHDIIGLKTVKDYKVKGRRVILKFEINKNTNINDIVLFSCDDIFVDGTKEISKFTPIKISSRYRGIGKDGNTQAVFVFEKRKGKTDLGFIDNQDKFGFDFLISQANPERSKNFEVIEMPFYLSNRDLSSRVLAKKNVSTDPLVAVEDMFGDDFGKEGYKVYSDGRVEFDKDRLFVNLEQAYVQMNCFFKRRLIESSEKSSTVSMRMDGETLERINEKIEELGILTKKDLTLSDYIRGLIAKDLN